MAEAPRTRRLGCGYTRTMSMRTFAGPVPALDVHAAPSGLMPFVAPRKSVRVAEVMTSEGPTYPSRLQLTMKPYAPAMKRREGHRASALGSVATISPMNPIKDTLNGAQSGRDDDRAC